MEGRDRVVAAMESYLFATPACVQSRLAKLKRTLLEDDHVSIRILLTRSSFACLVWNPEKLAGVLAMLLDCKWNQVKEEIMLNIIRFQAFECYSFMLSNDVEIGKLWPIANGSSDPFLKVMGVTTDVVFSTLLPDHIFWEIISPIRARAGAFLAAHNGGLNQPQINNFCPVPGTKTWFATETMRSCNSVKGLCYCLSLLFRRPNNEVHLLLLKVLVLMGHRPSSYMESILAPRQELHHFFKWYRHTRFQVASLQHSARLAVRRSMKKDNLKFAVPQLFIPDKCKKYILFSDLEELLCE